MDGADIFLGLAIIGFAALVIFLRDWKEYEGRQIARRSESQSFIDLYEETQRERALSSVQRRAQGAGPRRYSWTPENGNPVGYYGRMLWMRLFRRYTRED